MNEGAAFGGGLNRPGYEVVLRPVAWSQRLSETPEPGDEGAVEGGGQRQPAPAAIPAMGWRVLAGRA